MVELLAAKGAEAVLAPMFEVRFLAAEPLELGGIQAVVFTSGNGVRAFAAVGTAVGTADGHRSSMLAVAVGDSTARLAAGLGFSKVLSADGDLGTLAALITRRLRPEDGGLFYPSAAVTADELQRLLPDFAVRRRVLYEARAVARLPESVADNLERLTHAVFYSPRTAEVFCRLAAGLGLEKITALALSSAVADRLGRLPWREVKTASAPTTGSLLSHLG